MLPEPRMVVVAAITQEVSMKMPKALPLTTTAILTLAEIKAATEAFDRGETNVFEALDAVVVAIEAYRAAEQPRREAA